MKKVFRAIGRFFKSIWRYVKQNAWIQPILMVGLIFAIIFGLTAAPDAWDTVKGWFTTDSEEPQHVEELGGSDSKDGESAEGTKDLIKMFEDDETFIVIFGGTDCSLCKSFNKSVLNVYLDSDQGKKYRDDIYYYYSNQYIEYINSVYEDDGKDAAQDLVDIYEDKLMTSYYIPAYEEFEGNEYSTMSTVGDEIEFYSAETPAILYVVDGEVMGMLFGDISGESNALLRFGETIAAWETAKEDFEAGVAEFKAVLELL